jgi:hypothetical protein
MDKLSKPNPRHLRLTNKTILSSHSLDVEKQYLNLLHLARVEAAKIGLSEFARRLQIDVSNLSKVTDGKRKLGRQLAARLREIFRGAGVNITSARGQVVSCNGFHRGLDMQTGA